jgi:integrase
LSYGPGARRLRGFGVDQGSHRSRPTRCATQRIGKHRYPTRATRCIDHGLGVRAQYRERRLRQGATARTVQKHLVILHGVLKHAARKRGLTNGAADAERVTVPKRPYHYYSLVEVERWAEATPAPQDAAIIRVAAYTGLRLGELRALRWSAVDLDGRKLHVNLTHDDRARRKRPRPAHTYGTYMTAATGDLWRVKAWMGHSSVTVTEIYAHHLPRHDDAAEQSMGLARLREREAA